MQDTKPVERRPFDVTKMLENVGAEIEKPPAREPLLATRQTTHGSFQDNAIMSQSIKSLMRASEGWKSLTDIEREAMDMIALKFSRILSGKSMERQHWEDVKGYAALVEEQCA